MTTERSGMSLEEVARWHRVQVEFHRNAGHERGMRQHREMAEAIEASLSRDSVVSDEDVRRACKNFDPVGWKLMGGDSRADFKASVRRMLESFAARPAAVPDAKPLPELMLASYHEAVGWNACREAMLAQRDGGEK